MNAKRIIVNYLREKDLDGLCTDDCGCGINDFAPCNKNFAICKPAKKHIHKMDSEICISCEFQSECAGHEGHCYREAK